MKKIFCLILLCLLGLSLSSCSYILDLINSNKTSVVDNPNKTIENTTTVNESIIPTTKEKEERSSTTEDDSTYSVTIRVGETSKTVYAHIGETVTSPVVDIPLDSTISWNYDYESEENGIYTFKVTDPDMYITGVIVFNSNVTYLYEVVKSDGTISEGYVKTGKKIPGLEKDKEYYTDSTFKNPYDYATPVTSNIAIFERPFYKISLLDKNDQLIEEYKVYANDRAYLPMDGFEAYYLDKDFKEKADLSLITKDMNVYAKPIRRTRYVKAKRTYADGTIFKTDKITFPDYENMTKEDIKKELLDRAGQVKFQVPNTSAVITFSPDHVDYKNDDYYIVYTTPKYLDLKAEHLSNKNKELILSSELQQKLVVMGLSSEGDVTFQMSSFESKLQNAFRNQLPNAYVNIDDYHVTVITNIVKANDFEFHIIVGFKIEVSQKIYFNRNQASSHEGNEYIYILNPINTSFPGLNSEIHALDNGIREVTKKNTSVLYGETSIEYSMPMPTTLRGELYIKLSYKFEI